jgi:hypothetical protein
MESSPGDLSESDRKPFVIVRKLKSYQETCRRMNLNDFPRTRLNPRLYENLNN